MKRQRLLGVVLLPWWMLVPFGFGAGWPVALPGRLRWPTGCACWPAALGDRLRWLAGCAGWPVALAGRLRWLKARWFLCWG